MPVEAVEGRAAAKGKSAARNAPPAQDGQGALTALQRIGERAISASLTVDPRWEPGTGNPSAGLCPGGGPKGPSLPGREVSREPAETAARRAREERAPEAY